MSFTRFCKYEEGGINRCIVDLTAHELTSIADVSRFKADVVTFVNRNHPAVIIVDLKGVKTVSTDVFGVLLSIHRSMNEWKGEVRICNLHPFIADSIRQCGLERILSIFTDMKSALAPKPADTQ